MLDIGGWELMVVVIAALVIVGPKELPKLIRAIMGIMRKMRMMAGDFQNSLNEIAREADVADIQNTVKSVTDGSKGTDKLLKEFGLDDETGNQLKDFAGDIKGEADALKQDLSQPPKQVTADKDDKADKPKKAKATKAAKKAKG